MGGGGTVPHDCLQVSKVFFGQLLGFSFLSTFLLLRGTLVIRVPTPTGGFLNILLVLS